MRVFCGWLLGLKPCAGPWRLNQMRSLISTAPEPTRAELRGLNVYRLLERASTYRPNQAYRTSLTKTNSSDVGPAGHHPRGGGLRSTLSSSHWSARTAPRLVGVSGHRRRLALLVSAAATTPSACVRRSLPSPISAVPHRSTPAAASRSDIGLNRGDRQANSALAS